MKISSASFQISSPTLELCPPPAEAEFAFIGRSNVGKSSLLNLLTNQKGLAKVSATPGHTKLINFFRINHSWLLVDLPGYGYAKVARAQRAKFNVSVAEYLAGRTTLVRTFVLVDSRLPPQQLDMEFVYWLAGRELPFSLVFTKIDKVKSAVKSKNIESFLGAMKEWYPATVPTFESSTKTREGSREILAAIAEELEREKRRDAS